ncbi:MAG: hypothetical protein LUD68_02315 [Rikenellaceae bacterium]|nr:hypothetical protein [Rikenellaceae bacterium]
MMTIILLAIGIAFLMGWIVAISLAIRTDLRDWRERKETAHHRIERG